MNRKYNSSTFLEKKFLFLLLVESEHISSVISILMVTMGAVQKLTVL